MQPSTTSMEPSSRRVTGCLWFSPCAERGYNKNRKGLQQEPKGVGTRWFFGMVQNVDNVANIRYSCVSKREKVKETRENLENFKMERENGAGGGPFQSIKKETFALAPSFGLAICDTSSKCARAEGHSDRQIPMRSPLHSL